MKNVSPHPNLIEYIGCSNVKVGDGHVFYILMELCTVQLSQAIADRSSNPWSEAEVLDIFIQVSSSPLAPALPIPSSHAIVTLYQNRPRLLKTEIA